MYTDRCSTIFRFCRELSWEAATERMLGAAEMGPNDWPKAVSKVAEATLFSAYNAALGTAFLCKLDFSLHPTPYWLPAVPQATGQGLSQVK